MTAALASRIGTSWASARVATPASRPNSKGRERIDASVVASPMISKRWPVSFDRSASESFLELALKLPLSRVGLGRTDRVVMRPEDGHCHPANACDSCSLITPIRPRFGLVLPRFEAVSARFRVVSGPLRARSFACSSSTAGPARPAASPRQLVTKLVLSRCTAAG